MGKKLIPENPYSQLQRADKRGETIASTVGWLKFDIAAGKVDDGVVANKEIDAENSLELASWGPFENVKAASKDTSPALPADGLAIRSLEVA